MAKKGKCDDCRRLYHWPDDCLLSGTKCPTCHQPLTRAKENTCPYPAYTVENVDVEWHPKRKRKWKALTWCVFFLLIPYGPKAIGL